MSDHELLAAYDRQLRTDAETPSAIEVDRLGPLRLVVFAGGRGFVTYADLDLAGRPGGIDALVADALTHYRDRPDIDRVEWKTRGHDVAPGLHEALVGHGFVADEPESIMIGETRLLAVDLALPAGVTLRAVGTADDARAVSAMSDEAFGDPYSPGRADAYAAGLSRGTMQLWVAEVDGRMISAGRLEPVAGTDFAGLWGGATLPDWRGRGVYRALTAARAHAALALGRTLVHSDSTEFSRPILERSGLVKVSTTTPYHWHR